MGSNKKRMKNFCNSKQYLVQYSFALADLIRGTGVTVNVVDPGIAKSTGYRSIRGPLKPLFLIGQKIIGKYCNKIVEKLENFTIS